MISKKKRSHSIKEKENRTYKERVDNLKWCFNAAKSSYVNGNDYVRLTKPSPFGPMSMIANYSDFLVDLERSLSYMGIGLSEPEIEMLGSHINITSKIYDNTVKHHYRYNWKIQQADRVK